MKVSTDFRRTLEAVEQVLREPGHDPNALRRRIKELVNAYVALDVVQAAYMSFADSGVTQMRNFLRAANVRKDERLQDYAARVSQNLESMRKFADQVLVSPSRPS